MPACTAPAPRLRSQDAVAFATSVTEKGQHVLRSPALAISEACVA